MIIQKLYFNKESVTKILWTSKLPYKMERLDYSKEKTSFSQLKNIKSIINTTLSF